MSLNGADILARILAANGIDTCFANPGTTEMHLVTALAREHGIATHLSLFEGVATGAADGFFRMSRRPAATLLHLGPGLANGLANLHNARKAASPVLNIVGEHALPHIAHNAPLTADIAGLAAPVSKTVKTLTSVAEIGADALAMLEEMQSGEQGVGTLIAPNDIVWTEAQPMNLPPVALPPRASATPDAVAEAAEALAKPGALLLIGASHITARAVMLAHGIAAKTGARLLGEAAIARLSRGGDVPDFFRIPFQIDMALDALKETKVAILAGARAPVAFFAYPDRPSALLPPACETVTLSAPEDDLEASLEALAAHLGAEPLSRPFTAPAAPAPGPITPESLGAVVAHVLPEGAIVADESVTNGAHLHPACAKAPAHDWINNRGGSIGYAMPLAHGAAAACPDRPVIAIVGDGSAAYTLQALWSMARARQNVTVVILSNRRYKILANEMSKIGAGTPDETTDPLLSLDQPPLGWCDLARGFGVPAESVSEAPALAQAIRAAIAAPGPHLIEAVMAA